MQSGLWQDANSSLLSHVLYCPVFNYQERWTLTSIQAKFQTCLISQSKAGFYINTEECGRDKKRETVSEREMLSGCECVHISMCVFNFSVQREFHHLLAGRALCGLWTPCVSLPCVHEKLLDLSCSKWRLHHMYMSVIVWNGPKLSLPFLLFISMWTFTPAVGQSAIPDANYTNTAGFFSVWWGLLLIFIKSTCIVWEWLWPNF